VLESERIFIDTGGRPSIPRIPGLDQAGCLSNESILQVTDLPEHGLTGPRDLAGMTTMTDNNRAQCTPTSYSCLGKF